jgi:hypothetical protein
VRRNHEDDKSGERCGPTSEADGRSDQGDRIDLSVVRTALELCRHREEPHHHRKEMSGSSKNWAGR